MSGFALAAVAAAFAGLPHLQQPATPFPDLDADLAITATVRFDSLTFETVGAPQVEFTGTLPDKTYWIAERINLPDTLEPGVTYRDGGLRLRIGVTFKGAESFLQAVRKEAERMIPKPGGGGQ
jgi:hypothetical protein